MFNLVNNFKPSIEIFLHVVLVFSIPDIKRGKRDQYQILKIAAANMVLVDGVLVRTAAKESGLKRRNTLQRYLTYQADKTNPITYFSECGQVGSFYKRGGE